MAAPMDLVLASSSPRRRALLEDLGLAFRVVAPEVDEARRPGEAPAAYARRLASDKVRAVAGRLDAPAAVLGADTVVVLGDEVLGKPEGAAGAREMIRALSGRAHRVITGVALAAGGDVQAQAVITRVRFRPLAEREIDWYVGTGEALDAAGAYKIQGRGGVLVTDIEGSHSNVIGLPLAETLALLAGAGIALPWEPAP